MFNESLREVVETFLAHVESFRFHVRCPSVQTDYRGQEIVGFNLSHYLECRIDKNKQ